MYLGNDAPNAVATESSAPKESEQPTKIYSAAERQALAKEILPPDVIEYLQEEFRAEFNSVRKLSERKLY